VSSISSLVTNYNIQQVVNQLIALERRPLDRLEDQKDDLSQKKTDLSDIDSALESLQNALADLILDSAFSSKTATSSDTSVISATASAGAVSGTYNMIVYQLAQSQIVASDQVDTILGGSGNTADTALNLSGTFTINDGTGTSTISVVSSDSLNSIASKINSAVYDSDGTTDLGVVASVVDYRLVIQRESAGATQMAFSDVTGSVLDSLGVFIDHQLSGANIEVAGGTAHLTDGGSYPTTEQAVYTKVFYTGQVTSFDSITVDNNDTQANGSIKIDYSTDGGNSWTYLGEVTSNNQTLSFSSAITGETQIQFRIRMASADGSATPEVDSLTLNYTDLANNSETLTDNFSDTELNQIQVGRNAYFTVNGLLVTRSSNTGLTDVIQNVTLNLNGRSSTQTGGGYTETTLTISSDTDAAVSAVNSFVSSFNSAMSTMEDKLDSGEPLENDSMLRSLRRNLISRVLDTISNPGEYSHVSQLGISFDHDTNRLSLDESTFLDAIQSNVSGVADFFGYDSDSDGIRDDGGLAATLDSYLEDYTKSSIGIIASRQSSIDDMVDSLNRRIDRWEARLEKRREYLFNQFVQMQTALNRLADQSRQISIQQAFLMSVMSSGSTSY